MTFAGTGSAGLGCLAVLLGSWLPGPGGGRAVGAPDRPTPLADAIRAFNARARDDPIGRDQPPLTEDEVIAAIRWSARGRAEAAAPADYDTSARIAETRRLPPGAELEVLTGFQPDDDNVFTAWSVRIRIGKAAGDGSYAFPIRDRWIGWRPVGPEERKVLGRWDESWRKQGGIAGFDRARYARGRAEAIARDREAKWLGRRRPRRRPGRRTPG